MEMKKFFIVFCLLCTFNVATFVCIKKSFYMREKKKSVVKENAKDKSNEKLEFSVS